MIRLLASDFSRYPRTPTLHSFSALGPLRLCGEIAALDNNRNPSFLHQRLPDGGELLQLLLARFEETDGHGTHSLVLTRGPLTFPRMPADSNLPSVDPGQQGERRTLLATR
jgi:hypothetical protein